MKSTIDSASISVPLVLQAETDDAAALPLTIIEARRGWRTLDVPELWRHRELVGFLVWRDIKIRYKQTALGAAWAVLQPLATMAVFSLFFGRLAGMPSDGVPYPLFAMAALVPWTFFATSLQTASGSLVSHQSLLTKVYFPRSAVPLATVLASFLDMALALLVLGGMLVWAAVMPTWDMLWLLPLMLVAGVAAFGVGLLLSALNVSYRDVRYVLPFLIQLWLFATPVAYPISLVPAEWHLLYALNPMVGVVAGFRWALFGAGTPAPLPLVAVSAAAALFILLTGAAYFARRERTFADVV